MPHDRMHRVKGVLLLATGLLVIAQAWASGGIQSLQKSLAIARNEPSRVVVDALLHDFGAVPQGPQLQVQFQLLNAGGRRLILHREDGGCPCLSTTPELSLPPGASLPLTATLQTDQLTGPLQTRIRYRTNDPNRPVLELTLLADILRDN